MNKNTPHNCFECPSGIYKEVIEPFIFEDGTKSPPVSQLVCGQCGDTIISYEISCLLDEFLGIEQKLVPYNGFVLRRNISVKNIPVDDDWLSNSKNKQRPKQISSPHNVNKVDEYSDCYEETSSLYPLNNPATLLCTNELVA